MNTDYGVAGAQLPSDSPSPTNPAAEGLVARIEIDQGGLTVDLTLDIAPGTTTALIGPNGAGKTTTVNALAGLRPIDSGRIELAGRVLDDGSAAGFIAPEDRRIGVVFQSYRLFDHLSVIDNIAFGLAPTRRSRRRARAEVAELVEAFDLGSLTNRKPSQLSGGQAQRVALARALAIEPDLLLLDEPLAALDVATRSQLRRFLAQHLARFAGPRLLITHDPTDANLLADEICIIEQGRVTQRGRPDELRRRPATPYVAELVGTNLLVGFNQGGTLDIDGADHQLQTADTSITGPVLITIAPNAIALHPEQPHGSPRNTWLTEVESIEPLGDTTRILLGGPLSLVADITPASTAKLGLAPGSSIWATIKATEIQVNEHARDRGRGIDR